MKTHIYTTRVRYVETDQMGFAHNSKYLVYFEEARTDLVRAEDYPYKKMEQEGVLFPLSKTEIEFKVPLQYDDEIQIEVTVSKLKTFSAQFNYTIRKTDGTVCASGYTLHAAIAPKSKGFTEIPESIHQLLKRYAK